MFQSTATLPHFNVKPYFVGREVNDFCSVLVLRKLLFYVEERLENGNALGIGSGLLMKQNLGSSRRKC